MMNSSSSDCGVVLAAALQGIPVDVLVYAAADGWVGPLFRETEESIRKTVATNFTGFALVAKHVIKGMLATAATPAPGASGAAGEGGVKSKKVVVLSSVQTTRPTPMFATYVVGTLSLEAVIGSRGMIKHTSKLLHPRPTSITPRGGASSLNVLLISNLSTAYPTSLSNTVALRPLG
jgi:NAD(P)-dependent dehydrogenase (short-subunit alcohol dehydrogenase family)